MSKYKALEILCDNGPTASMYRLVREDGRLAGSTCISFTPGGILISGDMAPGTRDLIQAHFKSRDWFASELGESYLTQKFLHKCWVPEEAHASLTNYLDERDELELTEKQVDCLKGLMDRLPCDVHEFEFIDDLYDENLWDGGDPPPGFTYRPNDVALLVDIQASFRRLYGEHVESEKEAAS